MILQPLMTGILKKWGPINPDPDLGWWVYPQNIRMFPKIGVVNPPKMDGENFMENPMNKWADLGGKTTPTFGSTLICFIMENPIKMDDLGVLTHPYFWFNTHMEI